jgi:protein TonB
MPENTLAWAVAVSISLHLFAVVLLPNFPAHEPEAKPEVLTIEIAAPKAPEPATTIAEPEPVPQPPKPEVQPKIEPRIIPTPKPAPVETYEPQTSTPQAVVDPAPPTVMSVAPKADATPVFTAPPPPPEPPGPSQADLDSARKGYADRLARAIAAKKQYPRVAQMRGWQGEVLIDLKLDANGTVLETTILRSSGFEVLDKQALEMVKKAAPFPPPPEILKSNIFNIQVPVSFKLE